MMVVAMREHTVVLDRMTRVNAAGPSTTLGWIIMGDKDLFWLRKAEPHFTRIQVSGTSPKLAAASG